MGFLDLFFIGAGLAMDAFAVALCKGLSMRRINYAHAAVIALFFGVFQAVMPLIGWVLGTQFARYITSVDHWIAFALLGYIGGKMGRVSRGAGIRNMCVRKHPEPQGTGDAGGCYQH